MTTHSVDCIDRFPNCICLTCANDSKSNACCINHARHCYITANCEDYVFETQDESFKIPKIKKEKEIQEESEVKQISFESLMKGDATAWNASKQQ